MIVFSSTVSLLDKPKTSPSHSKKNLVKLMFLDFTATCAFNKASMIKCLRAMLN